MLLGDQAFSSQKRIITHYSSHQLERSVGSWFAIRQRFNRAHSGDRICSEHGIGMLKEWGIIRGRSDVKLFDDSNVFARAVKVIWALQNFKLLQYPINSIIPTTA